MKEGRRKRNAFGLETRRLCGSGNGLAQKRQLEATSPGLCAPAQANLTIIVLLRWRKREEGEPPGAPGMKMTTSGRGGASLKPTSRFAGFAFIAFQQDGLRWPAFQESDTMKDDIISRPFNGLTSSSIIVGLRGKKKKKGKIRWVWISRGSITSRNHNEALESLVQVAFISAAWFTPRAHHRGSTGPAVSRGKLTPKSDLHICPLVCSTLYPYVFFILFYLFIWWLIAPTLWTMSQWQVWRPDSHSHTYEQFWITKMYVLVPCKYRETTNSKQKEPQLKSKNITHI